MASNGKKSKKKTTPKQEPQMVNQSQMTLEQAMTNVENVCSVFKGSLTDHQNIQLSLNTIKQVLMSAIKKPDEKKTDKK